MSPKLSIADHLS